MLDMEALRLDWFRGEKYQDMFRFMDSTGGFWVHRWGNNPFRTFAVGLLLDDTDVRALTLPYAHQDYCSCGPGAKACVWDKQLAAFQCPEVPSDAPRIVASSLHEGLLDLQPWRGTERQRRNFDSNQILHFISEQLPV